MEGVRGDRPTIVRFRQYMKEGSEGLITNPSARLIANLLVVSYRMKVDPRIKIVRNEKARSRALLSQGFWENIWSAAKIEMLRRPLSDRHEPGLESRDFP